MVAQVTSQNIRKNFCGSINHRFGFLLTPAHASWLNQAELLLRSFACRYLDRGDWSSKEQMIDHLNASWPEYNRLFAHPISWSWTRPDMHKWVERHKRHNH